MHDDCQLCIIHGATLASIWTKNVEQNVQYLEYLQVMITVIQMKIITSPTTTTTTISVDSRQSYMHMLYKC